MSSERVYLRCCGCCSGAVDGFVEFSIVEGGNILRIGYESSLIARNGIKCAIILRSGSIRNKGAINMRGINRSGTEDKGIGKAGLKTTGGYVTKHREELQRNKQGPLS
jgi:hypothetical protein